MTNEEAEAHAANDPTSTTNPDGTPLVEDLGGIGNAVKRTSSQNIGNSSADQIVERAEKQASRPSRSSSSRSDEHPPDRTLASKDVPLGGGASKEERANATTLPVVEEVGEGGSLGARSVESREDIKGETGRSSPPMPTRRAPTPPEANEQREQGHQHSPTRPTRRAPTPPGMRQEADMVNEKKAGHEHSPPRPTRAAPTPPPPSRPSPPPPPGEDTITSQMVECKRSAGGAPLLDTPRVFSPIAWDGGQEHEHEHEALH
jgi:hypothetical protein